MRGKVTDVLSSYRQVSANSVDQDQIAPGGAVCQIRVYTVCHSVCIFWIYYRIVKAHCYNFRLITAIFLVSEFSGLFGGTDTL